MKNIDFIKYNKEVTTFKYGHLFYKDITFRCHHHILKRTIYVLLPEDYEEDKKYKVLYMFDGQNLFDLYTSSFGEWKIDRLLHKYYQHSDKRVIVVGISSPKSLLRHDELCPFSVDNLIKGEGMEDPYFQEFSKCIINKIMPLVDKNFSTLKGENNIGVGGSSMGGLSAIYLKNYYPSIFSFCLCFSPAFFLYKKENIDLYFLNIQQTSYRQKYFFMVGGKDEEAMYYKDTIYVFSQIKNLLKNSDVEMIFDSSLKHHEESWSKYFLNAIEMFLL